MRISTNDKNTLNRNPGDGTMNGKSVTAFLLSPHCRIYRHILLQVAVLLITINVFLKLYLRLFEKETIVIFPFSVKLRYVRSEEHTSELQSH